jgi:plasmid replication initiation protein
MAATPYEILTFFGRGAGARDYQRLKAGLDRLQSTTVANLDTATGRASPPSLLLDQRVEGNSRPQRAGLGIELILPDWFYAGILDDAPLIMPIASFTRRMV